MVLTQKSFKKNKPPCSVFGECGGCSYQDLPYEEELILKDNYLRELLQKKVSLADNLFEPIVSSPKDYHYRHRLDLKLVQTRTKEVFMGFSPFAKGRLIPVDSCPIAIKEVSDFLPTLKEQAKAKLSDKYRQANLVIRTGDDHRVLWGGIGRRSLQLKEEDYLWTTIAGKKIFYSLDTFFQANLSILPKLFERLYQFDCWGSDVSFYDLYGGVGLFAIGLIEKVDQVFLIEECGASLKLARYNAQFHGFKNFQLVEGRVEDKLGDVIKEDHHSVKVAFIDPPRAGLSDTARALLTGKKEFNHLFYLSCNPEALGRDLNDFISKGWKVEKIIPFDFFPRTKHLETLVLLNN